MLGVSTTGVLNFGASTLDQGTIKSEESKQNGKLSRAQKVMNWGERVGGCSKKRDPAEGYRREFFYAVLFQEQRIGIR
jgi:hypothetical protein